MRRYEEIFYANALTDEGDAVTTLVISESDTPISDKR